MLEQQGAESTATAWDEVLSDFEAIAFADAAAGGEKLEIVPEFLPEAGLSEADSLFALASLNATVELMHTAAAWSRLQKWQQPLPAGSPQAKEMVEEGVALYTAAAAHFVGREKMVFERHFFDDCIAACLQVRAIHHTLGFQERRYAIYGSDHCDPDHRNCKDH